MLTAVDQVTELNGQKFYSRPCRFELDCANYNPALTLQNRRGVVFLNKCTHGGGCACSDFVRIYDNTILKYGGLR